MGARYTLILGEDEINSGTYLLKNMTTGVQQQLKREELAARIKQN
jgi:histidyl-tRNA synthetase